MKSFSLKALNLVESAGIGATATFMPLFANALTNSYVLVGAIVAGYGLAQALSYAYFARIYDGRGSRARLVLIRLGYLLCAAAFFMHLLAFDGLSLFAIRIFAGVATGVYAGALIAKAYEASAKKLALAGIISFGSLGWFVGTIGAGALKEAFAGDARVVFALSGAMFFAGFAVSLRLRHSPADDAETNKEDEMEGKTGGGSVRTTLELLRHNRTVYSSFFLRQFGASAVWSMFPIFLAKELGASDFWIGAIYAANAMTQFVFMNRFGRFTHSNYYRSIQLGAALSAAVFGLYFVAQEYWQAFPIQVVLGVSWSTLYIGSLLLLLDRNREKATSSALLESTISVGAIAGPLAGGIIAELFGIRSVLLFAFAVTAGSFAMSRTLKRQAVSSSANVSRSGRDLEKSF
ncbi:MFS transporter [Nitrososphaera sp.]|uniref:MFS transporter n=1 Tax=Nitrososphaera sp. TaxID=1971748 RepID=UPI00307F002E